MTDNNTTSTNNNNNNDASSLAKAKSDFATLLTPSVLQAFHQLTVGHGVILEYEGAAHAIAGVGENSYGKVFKVKITPTRTIPTFARVPSTYSVVKIAPENAARREHMQVTDYYKREIFMYEQVFRAFAELEEAHFGDELTLEMRFNVVPQMNHYSLENNDEFIIFEDLQKKGYVQNARTNLPTFDLVAAALKSVGQLHAMSFVLQALRPELYAQLIEQMKDNLFTKDIEPISIEFGKSYVRRTRVMLQQDKVKNKEYVKQLCNVLNAVESQFKSISLHCVDGKACTPYAVICHGDFWNNNILYRYDASKNATSAKLVDFQMSRYASPVLDVVHYLFACTEKDLRDAHFNEFLEIYYTTLTERLQLFKLDIETIFPRKIYEEHLKAYGVYGLIMSSLALPFFISDATEIPDIDEVSEAIKDLSSSSSAAGSSAENSDAEDENKDRSDNLQELIDKYDLLSERTLPIFKRRMTGIVADLIKYEMAAHWLNWKVDT